MPIKKPIIQYGETVWAFTRRLASHLGTCVVPDITSGEPALWFGMRNGSAIPPLSENEYTIQITRTGHGDGKQKETGFETESRAFYKLGDKVVFGGQRLRIYGVSARFQHGELIFRYLLKSRESVKKIYQENFIGLGLTGMVVDVRNEQVKVALDIDGGKSTGDYYYDWYPETGNALYAMPEKGARVELCFGNRDEKEGIGLHCFLYNLEKDIWYKQRKFGIVDGNVVQLFGSSISTSNGWAYDLFLIDGYLSLENVKDLNIFAESSIHIHAKKISVKVNDELNICHG